MKKSVFKRVDEFDIVKLIFIFGLLSILLHSIFNIFIGFFRINLGWFLIYIGVACYFIIEGKPFLKSWNFMKNTKSYFLIVLFLFLLISLFGFFFPYFFKEQIIKLITELLEKTKDLGPLELISFIIANNIKSAFFGMIFGAFFGIISLSIAVVNGYVLGFVIKETVALEGFSILFRLVPHGILELPAVIISLALGLKLGMFLFVYKGKNKAKEFLIWLRDSVRVFVFIIIPLLVLAGIIEGVLIFVLG